MTDVEYSRELVQRELGQVLASPGFARNARMSQFLRFLVERHLDGRDEELKESLIAVEVFGRKPDYDPKLDSIVRTEAARLRARLIEYYAAEGRNSPVVIEVPKGGYVPSFMFPETTPAVPTPAMPMPALARVPPSRHALVATLTGLMIVVAGVVLWYAERPRAPIPIAVLPLVNLSDDPANEFFVDGLTDEIIRNLSIIDGLAVRSRTSSFALKGDTGNVHDKGRQLNADYLVEVSVMREGEQLRVDAHLIRVRDDHVVWSNRFDQKLKDVFAIQDEISIQIVNNLRLHLGRGRRHYEWNVPAYTAYLEAQGQSFGPSPNSEAMKKYEQAIALDPSLAPAYAGLSALYAIGSAEFPGDHPSGELAKMRSLAQRAVDLDPLLAEAYDALGLSQARDGEWGPAEQSFRRAIELDPNRAETRGHFANWLLGVVGRNEEQLEQFRAAAVADPLSPEVQFGLGWTLVALSRYDEAEPYCAHVPDTNALKPQCLARIRLGQGKLEEAVQILRASAAAHFNPQTNGFLGYALARSGLRDEAEQLAASTNFPNQQALIYAGLGDKDRALDALDRMSVRGPQRVGRYLNIPEFALLRDDPRLPALRKKVGLPQ